MILSLAVVCFSGMSALGKIASQQVPSIEVVFFRSLVGVPIILIMALRTQASLLGQRKVLLIVRSLSGTLAMMGFFYALRHIPVADAVLLNQTAPVFVLPMAAFYLGERVTWRHVLLALTALGGAALVIKPGFDVVNLPGLVAFGSALFVAIAYVTIRKLTATEHPLTIVLWFTVFSVLLTLPPTVVTFVVPSVETAAALIGVGVLGAAGQLLMTWAYSYGEAARLAVIGSLGALLGAGWDLVLWDHAPDLLTGAGGVLVIGASAALQVSRRSGPDEGIVAAR
ncbi:MAG: DMT family transporter [Deltaproteobacteria bacterium]|nr:DMT family transporter [Deltaproteobacteria bacterium]